MIMYLCMHLRMCVYAQEQMSNYNSIIFELLLCVYIFLYLSASMPTCVFSVYRLPVYQSVCRPISPAIYQSVHLSSIHLSIFLSIYVSMPHLYLSFQVGLFVCSFVCWFVCLLPVCIFSSFYISIDFASIILPKLSEISFRNLLLGLAVEFWRTLLFGAFAWLTFPSFRQQCLWQTSEIPSLKGLLPSGVAMRCAAIRDLVGMSLLRRPRCS